MEAHGAINMLYRKKNQNLSNSHTPLDTFKPNNNNNHLNFYFYDLFCNKMYPIVSSIIYYTFCHEHKK